MSFIRASQGGGGIDGSTATPTDTIATWLECADLHQSYTTLNEVLADTPVLEALINNTNAVDYLVRSTTWASDIVANELAMGYIGANNYCADTLLADSTWYTAICGSTYFESVLITKTPNMITDTSPSGQCVYDNFQSGWQGFNDNLTYYSVTVEYNTVGHIGYIFPKPVKLAKITLQTRSTGGYTMEKFKIQGTNDGSTWTDVTGEITNNAGNNKFTYTLSSLSSAYKGFRLFETVAQAYTIVGRLQFYCRSDYDIEDTEKYVYKATFTKSSSSGTDTFTLTDASITTSTIVLSVTCDKPMVNYTGITVSTGQIQITYNTSDAVGSVGFLLM